MIEKTLLTVTFFLSLNGCVHKPSENKQWVYKCDTLAFGQGHAWVPAGEVKKEHVPKDALICSGTDGIFCNGVIDRTTNRHIDCSNEYLGKLAFSDI